MSLNHDLDALRYAVITRQRIKKRRSPLRIFFAGSLREFREFVRENHSCMSFKGMEKAVMDDGTIIDYSCVPERLMGINYDQIFVGVHSNYPHIGPCIAEAKRRMDLFSRVPAEFRFQYLKYDDPQIKEWEKIYKQEEE